MKNNVYQMITNRILEQLEKGVIPWRKDWRDAAVSHATGKGYRGINALILDRPGEYATFAQIKKEGGSVKKGAHGYPVVYYSMITITDDDGDDKKIPWPTKYYTVFHLDDCEGVDSNQQQENKTIATDDDAEAVIADYLSRSGVRMEHVAQNRAFYQPSTDSVTLPLREQFDTSGGYYDTVFHELTHSTGHKKRLNRPGVTDKTAAFGGKIYSKEELVAEIGSAMVYSQLGMGTPEQLDNSTAYVQSWLQVLENDPRMVVSAANQAQRAADFILDKKAPQYTGEED